MTEENENLSIDEQDGCEEEPFWDYLHSPNGHEVFTRIIALIEDIKKSTLDKNTELSKITIANNHRQIWILFVVQGCVFISVVIAASLLAYFDKLTPALSILFGTLVGYFFGKKAV